MMGFYFELQKIIPLNICNFMTHVDQSDYMQKHLQRSLFGRKLSQEIISS